MQVLADLNEELAMCILRASPAPLDPLPPFMHAMAMHAAFSSLNVNAEFGEKGSAHGVGVAGGLGPCSCAPVPVLLVRAREPARHLGECLLGFPADACAVTRIPSIAPLCITSAPGVCAHALGWWLRVI